ncbi:MAG: prepilin-type N-terminal cleavage/methylation domain-containing protein [Sutterella sp.]|nr:prepilin-type N-terminal cleavage/methylation domain-containing protein [Sutterella sp.]
MSAGREEGFTLIEITMVLIVLGILASVAVSKFFDLSEEAEKEAVLASAAELQVRSEAVFGQKVLEGMSCTKAKTAAADVIRLSDTPAGETGRFGDFEFRASSVVAAAMPIDYRRAGSDNAWKSVPNFSFVLPICENEENGYVFSDAGKRLFHDFLGGRTGGQIKNDNGMQYTIYLENYENDANGKYVFNANIKEWNHTGVPIVSVVREDNTNAIRNVYIGFMTYINGENKHTDKTPSDDLLLMPPQSKYSDVTVAKRAENIEIFKKNFPNYQDFFEVKTTNDGYQYLAAKSRP